MLPRKNRLRDERTIKSVFKEKPIQARLFVIYKKRSGPPPELLVVTAAKRIKRATRRNRLRRRLHEAFREILPLLPAAFKIIVLAKPEAATASYNEIKNELVQALSQ